MTKVRDVKELLDIAKEVSNWIKGEKDDSLIIDCRNHIGTYSTTVTVGNGFSRWVTKQFSGIKEFDPHKVYDIKVYGLKPIPGRIRDAVSRTGDNIQLDFRKVLEYNLFRLEIEYNMDDDFLEGLVRKRSSPEPLQNAMKYHLSAQLKDPESLISGFNDLEIEEFPVTANIQIQDSINLGIAPQIKELAQVEAELLSEDDPYSIQKIMKLQKEKVRLKNKNKKQDVLEKLNEVSIFLQPTKFLNFVKLEESKDFRLHTCEWGNLFRALGLIQLPEKMKVTSRTDLTIDKPATSGILLYESTKFSEELLKTLK